MSTTAAVFGCQEFSQNAWKKDLCSNCFKPRADHQEQRLPTLKLAPDVRPPPCPCKPLKIPPHLSSAINNNNNNIIINNNNNNNVAKNWNSKKIGSNGVQLWEVGAPPLIEVQIQNGKKQKETSAEQKSRTSGHHVAAGNADVGNEAVKKVQSILRAKSVAADNGHRRASTVEFLEGSPKVIGYGGRDYEWNSSRDNSEDEDEDEADTSDLDSLDSFNLSEEDKAFTQLTDQNTEFNADNSNLLTAETFKATPVLVKSSPDDDLLVTKPSISDLYSKPTKSMTKLPHKMNSRTASIDEDSGSCSSSPPPPPPPPLSPPPTSIYAASSSANAQEFIRCNLYSSSPASTSDTDDFLDAEEFSSAEVSATPATPSSSNDHVNGKDKDDGQKPQHSEPSKSSTVKVGFQSVPVRSTGSTQQRASVQHLFKEEPVTAAERRAAFKQSLPMPSSKEQSNGMRNGTSDDVKNKLIVNCSPYGVVAVTSTTTTTTQESCKSDVAPQIPSCPPPDSDDESQRLPVRSAQRSSGANRSCHYASSYVTSSESMTSARESIKSQPPAPPLPNPYSSTTILKGLPSQKPPPPAIKPKPKLPVKPSAIRGQVPASQASNRTSVLYQEIDEDPLPASFEVSSPTKMNSNGSSTDQASTTEIDSSFESPRQGASSDGNSCRRVPKRRAPKPPKESIEDNLDSASRKLSTCSLSSLKDPPMTTVTSSAPKTSTPSKFLSSRSYTLNNSSSRTSSSSLESYCSRKPSRVDDDQHQHQQQKQNSSLSPQPSVYKDAKLKKNRFSLKKLLKFGTSKDGGAHGEDASKSTNGENRRVERLHILHPIDLMQNKSTNGDHSDAPSDCSPIRPISDHQVHNKAPEVAASAIESPSKEKPPPPRRFRSQQDVVEEPIKEKPVRPPPPIATAKQIYRKNNKLTRSHTSGGRDLPEDEKRNSIYDCGMEYANLGDVRNSVAPKKPGRCASSMTDITVDEDMVGVETRRHQLSASHVSLQNYGAYGNGNGGGHQPDPESGNYYSSANDQESWPTEDEDEDTDDMYADQAVALNDSEEHSQSSSFTSEVMSAIANRSSDNSDSTVNDGAGGSGHPRHQLAAEQACKVYEVVVVKGRTLEKVYSKLPVVSSDQADCFRPRPTSSPPSGPIADHVQSQTTDTTVDDGQRNGTTSDGGPWPLRKKFSRLSLRKAKSIVHKNLEDNYGAVVSANHQTLTQILDQVSQCQHANTSKLKQLEDAPLRWSDFALLEDSRVTMVGPMAFYSAVWQQSLEVTLMVSPEPLNATIHSGRNNPCVLTPTAEFEDHIPKEYVLSDGPHQSGDAEGDRTRRATVWVLERMRVETLTGVAEYLHLMSESDIENYERESCFVLLQLINGLKHLQVQGTEEVTNGTMDDFLLVMKAKDTNYRFLILPEGTTSTSSTDRSDPDSLSLCRCALKAMLTFLCAPSSSTKTTPEVRLERLEFISSKPAFRLIGDILMQERATSLSQAKLLLEYMIWGPSDQLGATHEHQENEDGGDQEKAYQRWLDLERATVLNNLIRTQSLWQIRLTVFEEYMLSFLVRTCAKTLREAAAQLQMAATSQP